MDCSLAAFHVTFRVAPCSCYGLPGASKDICDTDLRDCLRNKECSRIANASFENIDQFLVKEQCELSADLFYRAVRCVPWIHRPLLTPILV